MSDNLQKMALALSDVEAELIRRRQENDSLGSDEPSDEFLDMFDSISDEDYDLYDDDVDNEDD